MKRFIIFILLICLFISLATPSFATSFTQNNGWIDLLDYTSVDDYGNFFAITGGYEKQIFLECPSTQAVYYVDVLVQYDSYYSSYPLLSFSLTSTNYLQPVHLGSGLVRYYGPVPQGNYSEFSLVFTPPDSREYSGTLLSVDICNSFFFAYDLSCSGLITIDGMDDRTIVYQGAAVSSSAYVDFANGEIPSFFAMFSSDAWKDYDYIDIILGFYVGNINSITANYGDSAIPCEVSYLNSGMNSVSSSQYVNLRLDLRQINRSTSNNLLVTISGSCGYGVNLFSILGCLGYVDQEINPLFYYFKSIKDSLSSNLQRLLNALAMRFDSVIDSIEDLGDKISDTLNGSDSSLKTVFGESISINDAAAAPLDNLKLFGRSDQAGIPSINNPIPIISAANDGYVVIDISNGSDSQDISIIAPNGLPGIKVSSGGNYVDPSGQAWICDYIDFATNTYYQYIQREVLDGSESWIFRGSGNSGYVVYYVGDLGSVIGGAILCDYFPKASITGSTSDIGINIVNSSGYNKAQISFRPFSGSNLVNVLSWLTEHPMTVLYALSEPITYSIDSSPILPLNSIVLSEGSNTITSSPSVLMEVTYTANSSINAVNSGAELGNNISDLTNQMNNLEKPSFNNAGDISSIINLNDLASHTTFLSTVVNAPYISDVIMLALILSMAAYVLFGKR